MRSKQYTKAYNIMARLKYTTEFAYITVLDLVGYRKFLIDKKLKYDVNTYDII
jgi:hypothetical protein